VQASKRTFTFQDVECSQKVTRATTKGTVIQIPGVEEEVRNLFRDLFHNRLKG
jgi:hypothetical protein